MAVAARISEFEAMTTTDPLGAVGHSATSLADAGAVGAAGVATGAATGAAVVAVVAPEPPVAPLEKDQGQPPARDQGQPPARDQGQPPAPTVISMAAPPDKNGVVLTMGGEKLTIDSGGRLVNSSGQRCDQYGRLTKARGNKGGVNKKVAYEKGSRWHSSHWRDADEGSHWRDAEEGSRWHGSHWRYDDWHGADESDGNPWNKWTGTGSSSADAWMSNAPPAPSGPVPTSTKVTLTDCALGAGADLDQGDRDQGFDCTPDCAYAIAAKAQYVTGILAPPPPPPTEPTYEDMQDTVWASGGYTKEEWDEPI